MRKALLVLLVLLLGGATAWAESWISLGGDPGDEVDVRVLASDQTRIVIEFQLAGYWENHVTLNNQSYAVISLPGATTFMVKGFPDLPKVMRSVVIPDDAHMTVSLLESDSDVVPTDPILPSKGHFDRRVDSESVPYTFDDFYGGEDWFPKEPVAAGEPFILRDFRGMTIQFNPFRYRPSDNTVWVCRRAVVELIPDGSGKVNVKSRQTSDKISADFLEIYKRFFVNFEPYGDRYELIPEPGRMLVIAYDDFYNSMLPFVEWKLRKGLPTELIRYSEVVNNFGNIQTYISDAYYSQEGVTYVVLVGDDDQIPAIFGTYQGAASDPRYVMVEGGDLYPDALISRISATSSAQVDNQVNKFLRYERYPDTEGQSSWYHQGCGIASNETGGTGIPDWQRCDWLRDNLLGYTYTWVDQIYAPSATASQVTTAMNQGRSVVNYIGHGTGLSWSTTGFSVSNVNALSNGYMNPFIIDVACDNGAFTWYDACFAEAWLRAGSVAQPKGAIGMYSASTGASWVPPCVMQAEVIDLLVAEVRNSLGGLCFSGAMKALDEYPGNGSEGHKLVEQYNVFGDCSIIVRTDSPDEMLASYPSVCPIGASEFVVDVTSGGSPVNEALVCLYNDEVHASDFTDASGRATIVLDQPPTVVGTISLTVTAYNFVPLEDELSVVVPASVEMDPGAIPVAQPTPVTITVTDTLNQGIGDVAVAVSGWGVALYDTTNASGVSVIEVDAPYGQVLTVTGRRIGDDYDLFTESLEVIDAPTLSTVEVSSIVPPTDLTDTLILNYEGIVVGLCEPEFAFYIRGCGVDSSLVVGELTVTMEIVPTLLGDLQVAIGKRGYEIYVEQIPVIAIGGIAGVVDLADSEDDGGALVMAVGDDVYECTTSSDGRYLFLDLPDGAYTVSAFKAGYGDSTIDEVLVDDGQLTRGVDFALYSYRLFYSCSFEHSGRGFVVDGGQWEWGEPTYGPQAAHSQPMLWATNLTGSYSNDADARLETPLLDLTSASRAHLSFWHWYEFEGTSVYYDGGNVKVSVDEGPFQVVTPRDGYDGVICSGNAGIPNEPGFATPTAGNFWKQEIIDLDPYVGHQIKIRWHFGSDHFISTYAGWYLDDVAIYYISGVGVEEEGRDLLPTVYSLSQNYPNPFNPMTVIPFTLPTSAEGSHVSLKVYNLLGQLVRTLMDGPQSPGYHQMVWDGLDDGGREVASGVYLYKLRAGDFVSVQRMLKLK